MAHHKRKRPKNQRAGCLLCKPHKRNNAKDKEKHAVRRKLPEEADVDEYKRLAAPAQSWSPRERKAWGHSIRAALKREIPRLVDEAEEWLIERYNFADRCCVPGCEVCGGPD